MNPEAGWMFLNQLIAHELIPEVVVTPDPFYIKDEFFVLRALKFVAKRVLFLLNRQNGLERKDLGK